MTRPHEPLEMNTVWRRMLLTSLPVIVLGIVISLVFTYHDTWDEQIDLPLYSATIAVLGLGWLAAWRGWLPQQTLTLLLVLGSLTLFGLKVLLLTLFMPDPARAMWEITETLVWLTPTVTWAMLTERPGQVRQIYYTGLVVLGLLDALLLWHVGVRTGHFDQNLFRILAQFNLSSFVTVYGASYYLTRSDTLGQLRGERNALARLAYTDLLTGLPNRGRLDQRLLELTTQPAPFALLMVDVDSFKIVNDTLGHAAGDELLRQVAASLRDLSPDPEEVYRVSGDEFVLLLPGRVGQEARAVGARLHSLNHLTAYGSNQPGAMAMTLSIGISEYPHDTRLPAELLRHADSAMYSVKRAGRAQVRRYQPEQDAATERYQELVRALGGAHERGELSLVFQPIYALQDMQMVKVEALLRWHHPVLGAVSPGEFIPVAEQSGQIVKIGEWVLRESCRAVQQWPGLVVSVNVSSLQLLRQDFPAQVLEILAETGLPPQRLELELTETATMYEDARAIAVVQALGELGLSLSLDDYGSGYSNLGRLRALKVGGLKLDQSIVRPLTDEEAGPFSRAMTEAALLLARALGVTLTAEGLETPELVRLARELGCDLGQGYHLARPQPLQEMTRLYQQTQQQSLP